MTLSYLIELMTQPYGVWAVPAPFYVWGILLCMLNAVAATIKEIESPLWQIQVLAFPVMLTALSLVSVFFYGLVFISPENLFVLGMSSLSVTVALGFYKVNRWIGYLLMSGLSVVLTIAAIQALGRDFSFHEWTIFAANGLELMFWSSIFRKDLNVTEDPLLIPGNVTMAVFLVALFIQLLFSKVMPSNEAFLPAIFIGSCLCRLFFARMYQVFRKLFPHV